MQELHDEHLQRGFRRWYYSVILIVLIGERRVARRGEYWHARHATAADQLIGSV